MFKVRFTLILDLQVLISERNIFFARNEVVCVIFLQNFLTKNMFSEGNDIMTITILGFSISYDNLVYVYGDVFS